MCQKISVSVTRSFMVDLTKYIFAFNFYLTSCSIFIIKASNFLRHDMNCAPGTAWHQAYLTCILDYGCESEPVTIPTDTAPGQQLV